MYKSHVIRFKLENMPEKQDAPPQLNLSNSNARLIFTDLLGINIEEEISARDLIMKIDYLSKDQIDLHQRDTYSTKHLSLGDKILRAIGKEDDPGAENWAKGPTMHHMGLSAESIIQRLKILRQIALWAINHHYDTLYVA